MSATYAPKPGSVADRATRYLAAYGLTTAVELARALEMPSTQNLLPCIEAAIRHGRIRRVKVDGRVYLQADDGVVSVVAEPSEPAESGPEDDDDDAAEAPTFNLALWLDGDLTICGVTANENGTVVLTRDQVEQLRRFLGAS